MAVAFLAGMGLALREAARLGEDTDRILDLCFYVLIAAVVGSRILYVITDWPTFQQDPMEVFRIWHGGLVYYGGLIAAFFTALGYIRKRGLFLWKTADVLAPSIALGQCIGRIGCFFAGCCYGRPSHLPWAVIFTDQDSLAPRGIPLHPTQLYSSLNALCIFVILMYLRRIKAFEGQVFWTYVLLYGVTRSIIEFFRGDDRGILVAGMVSISQLISFVTAVIAVAMILILRRRNAPG